jgi:hypothetical protein
LDTARVVAECLASGAMTYEVRTVQEYWSFDPASHRTTAARAESADGVADVARVTPH